MANFHEVTDVDGFQALMSADLERVSALNFWATWAQPCKSMNEVFIELAKKYPKVLFLQVS
jgi:thiol-disulfide isomerase/thioredoxin